MLICLVGKSGSGKSYIAKLLGELSNRVMTIDIDQIGHQVLDVGEIQKKLISRFGKEILIDNRISRKKLSSIVFQEKEKMDILTDITWSSMEELIDLEIKKHPDFIIILDWQLLPKTKYFSMADLRILVDASLDIRMQRAMKRDSISKEKFLERELASLDFQRDAFDYIVENNGNENLEREVGKIYEKSIIHR